MASREDLSHDLKKLRLQHRHFYLSVYGENDVDAEHLVCGGGLDLGLSEEGMDHAKKLSRRFLKNPLKVKRIICAPELRTIQLADYFHDVVKGKMVIYREFADQNMGAFEGRLLVPSMDLDHPVRGEDIEDFSVRVHQGLLRVLQDKDLCLVVTHARVARVIFRWLGIGKEKIESDCVYSIHVPAGMGIAHFDVV
jgi:broad specificity phosphatase PhoE